MISDYDIVDTMFLEVFPLNLCRLDHGIGPCNVSMRSIRCLCQAIVWRAEVRKQVLDCRCEYGITADILYMEDEAGDIGKKEHVISFAHKEVGVTYLQYPASALVTHVMTL